MRVFRLTPAALAFAAILLAQAGAFAHPHVWVTMRSEIVYAADGSITGVRHAWTFDDVFSTFATQGLESKKKGEFTREELAPLAEVNVTSLKEFDFFTYAKVAGKKTSFEQPTDYWLELKDNMLTLRFTLPLKAPAKTEKFDVEVFDPSYFVDFSYVQNDAVRLTGAPASCKLEIVRPGAANAPGKPVTELPLAENYGSQFANRVAVKCP
ncbi:MAG: DUF1007 family protein [Proteobacteria bacterium]|nr:DUF1007 family protein [Pseudomonadota bacterium]